MTENDLLYAMRHVSSRYTDEARERAEKAAEKKRSRIVRRTALAAVGAAACFGLVLFGLSHIPEQDINVAESDAEVEVTQIAETSAAETYSAVPSSTSLARSWRISFSSSIFSSVPKKVTSLRI